MRAPRLCFLAVSLALVVAAPAAGDAWLEVTAPRAPESETDARLVEVQGQAGARGLRGHDLVIAIDVSDSTTQPSGVDLDGDGPEGLTDPARLARLGSAGADPVVVRRLAALDLEDSILFAELAAASVLIERLDPRQVRVGLVAFSAEARALAPLGADRTELRRALADLGVSFHRDLRGTHIAAAVELAVRMLRPGAGITRDDREASIVLLSDGAPTLPVHASRAEDAALRAADEANRLGVRIYSFAIGEALRAQAVFGAIAERTGGRLERIERPADAIGRLRRIDLADLGSVEVRNLTTGEGARALRTFPDGTFDGFLPLEPGVNRLRVTATATDGRTARADRLVTVVPGEGQGTVRVLEELRRRTRETELWVEVERGRDEQIRELSIEALAPDEGP